MINIIDESRCSGCHACSNICPQKCIEMKCDNEGFWYPKINHSVCVNCGLCEKVCPIINQKHNSVKREPDTYAAFSKNEEIRMNSSSGGMFTLIAEYIINQNGVVFGACFDNGFNVIHDYAENIEELHKFRGSKYVQSKIGNTYKQVKMFIDNGRVVLFTGTPCQIAGLYSYLEKDYDNLVTQDIICHGVPSPKVWRKYIDFREKSENAGVKNVSFRNKTYGWKRYSVLVEFENNKESITIRFKDMMIKAFLSKNCLRPSCHSCSFKNINRQSDITLADFWGIENIIPEMNDDKGTSLLILNSDKAKVLFNNIKENTIFKESKLEEAIKYNTAMIKSAPKNSKRKIFMKEIDEKPFDKVVKKYCEPSKVMRIMLFQRKVLGKIKRIILK